MARLFGDAYGEIADPYLRRASQLAERGRGTTSPNPVVGCVIVRDGVIVGEGWHERAGMPHAEVQALRDAGDAARGATAYVTLEPCAHQGRTPPCADALVAAGVTRVVIGQRDPNPTAAGGADVLRDHGVEVDFADDPSAFAEQLEEWLHFTVTGRPFVRVKTALTLDGRPALAPGTRSALTGEAARRLTMVVRARSDAVLVGGGTLRIDDPSLAVRDEEGVPAARQPMRVVLSRSGLLPGSCALLRDGLGPVAILCPADGSAVKAVGGAKPLRYEGRGLKAAFERLAAEGVVSVLVEAGPALLSALLEEDLVDELIVYHAGGFGGSGAPGLVVGESQADPAVLDTRFLAVEAGVTGGDAVTVWRPSSVPAGPGSIGRGKE